MKYGANFIPIPLERDKYRLSNDKRDEVKTCEVNPTKQPVSILMSNRLDRYPANSSDKRVYDANGLDSTANSLHRGLVNVPAKKSAVKLSHTEDKRLPLQDQSPNMGVFMLDGSSVSSKKRKLAPDVEFSQG
jgi:hypothetical protein